MTHHHNHSRAHVDPWTKLPEGFAERLHLEARLSAPIQDSALNLLSSALDGTTHHIVDLGSGAGAGTVVLAQAFPNAQIHAVDMSEMLLEKVRDEAKQSGISGRVQLHRADLNAGWPAEIPTGVDVVWASLSLHHVDNPVEVLRQIHNALRPGGAFVLTETPGDARFEPEDLGTGSEGLGTRVLDRVRHVADFDTKWDAALSEAGFTNVQSQELEFVASAQVADGAEYLLSQLRANQEQLLERGANEDAEELYRTIEAIQAGTSDAAYRAGRNIWVAKKENSNMDVAIIGGGAAGLSAAVALGRSRRNVVVIDDGQPRNAPADAAHNLLGNEGISPLELLEKGRAEAASYGVNFIKGRVSNIDGALDDFTVTLEGSGQQVHARRIILATGLVDDLPEIPGIREGWGATVLHCPFCHGWEVRDQKIAILARDEVLIHQVLLFRELSDDVTVYLHTAAEPTEEVLEQLDALNVPLVRGEIEQLVMDGNQIRGVQIKAGEPYDAQAAVVVPRFNSRTELFESLGGETEQTPFGVQIPTDPRGMTSIPGVWAAGNANNAMAMVSSAAAAGVGTGAAIHGDLVMSDLQKKVQARRAGLDK